MKLRKLLSDLPLTRLGPEVEAGLLLTSLPWPRENYSHHSLGQRATASFELGAWPNTAIPRRILMIADGGGTPAPEKTAALPAKLSSSLKERPKAEMELLERSPSHFFTWERHALKLSFRGKSVRLALGLRTGGEIHWWEACRLVTREDSPHCITVEMAGSIPREILTPEAFRAHQGYHIPHLHKHNWLSGHLYARLHSNGVCEIYARHLNNKFVDNGADLPDVVPVVGILSEQDDLLADGQRLTWDGTCHAFSIGGVNFDVSNVAPLATPGQPGVLERKERFLVWQPYLGAELFGGICPETLRNDPFIHHAEEQTFPRGMARTLRFSLSLSDRSPKIARYLAPAWWYGLCEEFLPDSILPVSNAYDSWTSAATQWIPRHIVSGGFEDGSVPRHASYRKEAKGRTRYEPGWEGEIPHAQFLAAWRSGDETDYDLAMRSAYHFSDVAIDHASKLVRMHGYAGDALSLPMNRIQGTLMAYLETGDPYLYDCAQAVTANAHWLHKNSWPRMAVGRDACYIRSAVMLYRYFGSEFYRGIAYEGALSVAHSQRPNGSFGDQGGGSGIHQWSGYISKPWMGLLAVNGLLDYLELFPHETGLQDTVRKFADWLMHERREHKGRKVWSYQHDYNGGREFFDLQTGDPFLLPTKSPWHHASLARLLGYCTMAFQDPDYLNAWAESFEATPQEHGDHSAAAALQFLPWLQARLWNIKMDEHGFRSAPLYFGERTPAEAIAQTPYGDLLLTMGSGTAKATSVGENIEVHFHPLLPVQKDDPEPLELLKDVRERSDVLIG